MGNIFQKDKTSWKSISLDDYLFWYQKDIPNEIQQSEGIEYYVTANHLDSDEILVKRQNLLSDEKKGPTITKHFECGDLLFSTRSVALRKAAKTKISGVTGEKLIVIRSKPDAPILKDLVPFIFHTSKFWEFALQTATGSVNKFSSWNKIKKYEHKLPPKDEQEKILSLFLTLENQIEQTEQQEINIRKLAKKIIDDFIDNNRFGTLLNDENLTEYKWKECVDKLLRRTDAVSDGIERIVAGENLESEDFKIRTWGTVGKDFLGPAFHVMFEPGDILYGSRRTYLRKVSLADFKGVCANTTFVVKAKEDILLQDLLKHIMLSERFTQYSIGKSKGSTNPYINWKDLDGFTFKLPNLDVQEKMFEILDGCIDLAEKARSQTANLKKLKLQLLDEILG